MATWQMPYNYEVESNSQNILTAATYMTDVYSYTVNRELSLIPGDLLCINTHVVIVDRIAYTIDINGNRIIKKRA